MARAKNWHTGDERGLQNRFRNKEACLRPVPWVAHATERLSLYGSQSQSITFALFRSICTWTWARLTKNRLKPLLLWVNASFWPVKGSTGTMFKQLMATHLTAHNKPIHEYFFPSPFEDISGAGSNPLNSRSRHREIYYKYKFCLYYELIRTCYSKVRWICV